MGIETSLLINIWVKHILNYIFLINFLQPSLTLIWHGGAEQSDTYEGMGLPILPSSQSPDVLHWHRVFTQCLSCAVYYAGEMDETMWPCPPGIYSKASIRCPRFFL